MTSSFNMQFRKEIIYMYYEKHKNIEKCYFDDGTLFCTRHFDVSGREIYKEWEIYNELENNDWVKTIYKKNKKNQTFIRTEWYRSNNNTVEIKEKEIISTNVLEHKIISLEEYINKEQ